MGIESDQEVVQLVGSDPVYADKMSSSLQDAIEKKIRYVRRSSVLSVQRSV